MDSVVHIRVNTIIYGIKGDKMKIPAKQQPKSHGGLADCGSNLCMTHDESILVNVRTYPPFSVEQATSDGGNPDRNVRNKRVLLPFPLMYGTIYYQTCFVNPHA